MATLFDRLVGNLSSAEADRKIPVHAFTAALQEWQDGAIARADVVAGFGLVAADDADLDWMKARFAASADKAHFVSVLEQALILAESRLFGYNVKATFAARINGLA
ncbi:MAG: hypothetical protein ACE5GS_06690 [Kiloniellaceae bacterium]